MFKVGLCGFGTMAKGHAQMLQCHEDVQLVAIADPVEANREKAAAEYGVKTYATGEELIDAGGLDVVFVVVPTYLHAPLTIRALKAGCHVFCEKPMALSADLCADMCAAAKAAGKALMIGQVLRFWPEYVYLKKVIDSGEYGKLLALSMQRVGDLSTGWENWYLDERRGGTQIFDRHVHDIDAILWMLGTPKEVYAYGAHRDPNTAGGCFHSVTEYYYGDDIMVSAEGSADTSSKFPFTATYRATFEKGVVEFNCRNTPTLQVFAGDAPFAPELPVNEVKLKSGMNITSSGPYLNEQVYFFDCLRKGVLPETITPEAAMETIRVARAEGVSVTTRTRVKL